MIDEFLTLRATILRAPAAGAMASGAAVSEHVTFATDVPFALWERGGSIRQQEFGKDLESNYRGATYFAISARDRVVIGDATYEATFVGNPRKAFYSCDLARITV